VDVCEEKLTFAVNGTVGPLRCAGGELNSLAWQYYANQKFLLLSVGPNATPGSAIQAYCSDLRLNQTATGPKVDQAYELAQLYYGWNIVGVDFRPSDTDCR
jgi:hypothetical protein